MLNFIKGIIVVRLTIMSLLLASCVSSTNARFYHPEHGVVNGEHETFVHDSKQCAINYQESKNNSLSTTGEAGVVAKEVGAHAIGNVLLGAEIINAGHNLAKNQSYCMESKGWSRLENAK